MRAFFYLLKPVEQKRLFRVLDQAVDKLRKRREEAVVVPTRGGARRVPLERIRYVERVGRVMRYCCTDGVVDSLTLRGSFREKAEPLLADPRFHLCGASFVLNLQHVAGVEGRTALLDDGSRILPAAGRCGGLQGGLGPVLAGGAGAMTNIWVMLYYTALGATLFLLLLERRFLPREDLRHCLRRHPSADGDGLLD